MTKAKTAKERNPQMKEDRIRVDICTNEVTRLAVNELIPFEQVEPFKRLARLLDSKVEEALLKRVPTIEEIAEEIYPLLSQMSLRRGVASKQLATAIRKLMVRRLGGNDDTTYHRE